jgi:hypothetical protein
VESRDSVSSGNPLLSAAKHGHEGVVELLH